MTLTPTALSAIRYPQKTYDRAACAVRCAPFRLPFYLALLQDSVPLGAIAGAAGLNHQYSQRLLSELTVEGEILWLIQVGLLRREVDGQGLTDRFRLTPLGQQLVQQFAAAQVGNIDWQSNWRDRLRNQFYRGWRWFS
jgi:hypothetical protein